MAISAAEKEKIISDAYRAAAQVFETYASDQLGCVRFQSKKSDKEACTIRAAIWQDAATELRAAATAEA